MIRIRRLHRDYVASVRDPANASMTTSRQADAQLVVVIITTMGVLIFLNYFGKTARVAHWISLLEFFGADSWGQSLRTLVQTGEHARLAGKVFWAGMRLFAYLVIPAVVIGLTSRRVSWPALSSILGLRTAGFFRHAPPYLALLGFILPVVVWASFAPSFQRQYPIMKIRADDPWIWLLYWELLYGAQFVALEVFFRGFLLQGLKPRFGYTSIWVMVVPYTMIHFSKPLGECVGSVVAGLALGTLSLKNNSIWWGAILHVAVAVTMDLLALQHRGFFG